MLSISLHNSLNISLSLPSSTFATLFICQYLHNCLSLTFPLPFSHALSPSVSSSIFPYLVTPLFSFSLPLNLHLSLPLHPLLVPSPTPSISLFNHLPISISLIYFPHYQPSLTFSLPSSIALPLPPSFFLSI